MQSATTGFRVVGSGIAVGSLTLFLSACPPGREAPGDIAVDSVQVELLKNGDIGVRDANASFIDGNRLLIEATVENARREDTVIVIRPEGEPIALRDNGEEGDRAAGDGIFSGVTTIDPQILAAEHQRIARTARGGVLTRFEGRLPIEPVRLELDALVDIRRLRELDRFPFFPLGVARQSLIDASLMITNTSVVTDTVRTFNPCTGVGNATGVWTFGHLMTEMANQGATGIAPSDFVRSWLAQWETAQTVNTFPIPARTAIQSQIIGPWEAASGGATLDLTKAPFRLLAIVNRVDLRQNLVYGGGSAGEGRFVFGAVRLDANCAPLPFAVIFEYGITKASCQAVKAWGKEWADLEALTPGTAAYNQALEAITQQFVSAGADANQTPNLNALNQLRTNEIAIGSPWELREFVLSSDAATAGRLVSTTTKQEPDAAINMTQRLADYVNANAALIVDDRHQVPLEFPAGQAFLASRSPVPSPSHFWGNGSAMPTANSRFHLSLNTCSGCHGGETSTPFVHVNPSGGLPAGLSGFLTGIDVTDPDPTDADNSVRHFDDLDRRAIDLDGLVNSLCLRQIGFRPINRMVH